MHGEMEHGNATGESEWLELKNILKARMGCAVDQVEKRRGSMEGGGMSWRKARE
jgi:hypothetical protein